MQRAVVNQPVSQSLDILEQVWLDGIWGLCCATLIEVDDESHLLNGMAVCLLSILVSNDGAADTEQE